MDAINVLKTVSSPAQHSIKANVIDDICDSLSYSGSGSVCYGSHEGNSVTHLLAKLALSLSNSCIWIDVLPKILDPYVKTNVYNLE